MTGSVRCASVGFLLMAALWGLLSLSPCDSGVILRVSGRRGGLFARFKHIPPLMHSWSTRAFVWEWDPISRLIHEDLGLRFPVAIKGVFPFLGLMSSLLTLSGLDQGWWIGVKVITEVNRVSVSCV